MNFLYLNSNLSGIGDRIHDIILAYTYSKYIGCNKFYFHWKIIENTDSPAHIFHNNIYGQIRKDKTPFRNKDYLENNLLNYIIFPDDIIFVSEEELEKLKNNENNENNFLFNDYLGLSYSVYTFIDKFLLDGVFRKLQTRENPSDFPHPAAPLSGQDLQGSSENEDNKLKFIDMYYKNFNKINFKNIPEDIINIFENNEVITIHLRRGDKVVNDNGVSNNITYDDLNYVDNKTEEFINNCILLNYKNICFISDEKKVKDKYIEKFNDKCNIINIIGDEVSQTYYDIYSISHSKKVLLSQIFSAFSLTASLIGNKLKYAETQEDLSVYGSDGIRRDEREYDSNQEFSPEIGSSCMISDEIEQSNVPELYYIYNKGKIINDSFYKYKNIIYIENFFSEDPWRRWSLRKTPN